MGNIKNNLCKLLIKLACLLFEVVARLGYEPGDEPLKTSHTTVNIIKQDPNEKSVNSPEELREFLDFLGFANIPVVTITKGEKNDICEIVEARNSKTINPGSIH